MKTEYCFTYFWLKMHYMFHKYIYNEALEYSKYLLDILWFCAV